MSVDYSGGAFACYSKPATSMPTYDFVGQGGNCVDSKHNTYERWWASVGDLQHLHFTVNVTAECSCPECEELCDANEGCLGYQFSCCEVGVRCIGAGASVLFSYGTRPDELPPSPFSLFGYYGSETSGPEFNGEGPIMSVDYSGGAFACYSKPATSMPTYDFVGQGGNCVDSKHNTYERWWASVGDLQHLHFTVNVTAECSCPECEELCDANEGCLGYQFSCCEVGVRCIGAGASVLFSYGTRPDELPPSPFSLFGYYGSETSGPEFNGEGPIMSVDYSGGAFACYSKRKPANSMQMV
jgi:hypothetical protein